MEIKLFLNYVRKFTYVNLCFELIVPKIPMEKMTLFYLFVVLLSVDTKSIFLYGTKKVPEHTKVTFC